MSMPTSLLNSQPPPTPTLQTPPSKQQALAEGNPLYKCTGLQKNMKNTESYKITQSPVTYLKALVLIQLP